MCCGSARTYRPGALIAAWVVHGQLSTPDYRRGAARALVPDGAEFALSLEVVIEARRAQLVLARMNSRPLAVLLQQVRRVKAQHAVYLELVDWVRHALHDVGTTSLPRLAAWPSRLPLCHRRHLRRATAHNVFCAKMVHLSDGARRHTRSIRSAAALGAWTGGRAHVFMRVFAMVFEAVSCCYAVICGDLR